MTHELMSLKRWVDHNLTACKPGTPYTFLSGLSAEDRVTRDISGSWCVHITHSEGPSLLRLCVGDEEIRVGRDPGHLSPEASEIYGQALIEVAAIANSLEKGYAKYRAEIEEKNAEELRARLARDCAELITGYTEGRVLAGKYWIEFKDGEITSVEETEED